MGRQFTPDGTSLSGSTSYGPWGAVTATTGTTIGSLGYQSQYTSPATGETDMGARWYSPATGSFANKDTFANSPVPDSASASPYAYAADNPLTVTDPSGHFISGPGTVEVNPSTPTTLKEGTAAAAAAEAKAAAAAAAARAAAAAKDAAAKDAAAKDAVDGYTATPYSGVGEPEQTYLNEQSKLEVQAASSKSNPNTTPLGASAAAAKAPSPHDQAVALAASELSSTGGSIAETDVGIPGASDQFEEEFGNRRSTGQIGYADIVMKAPSAVYIWEVKQWAAWPALQPSGIFTADGRPYAEFGGPSQLANYIKKYKEAGMNDGLPVEPGFPMDSPVTAPLAGRPGYQITVGNSWKMLGEDDLGSSAGIVTYTVTRIPKAVPEPDPVAEPAPAPWWETATAVVGSAAVVVGAIGLAPETGGTSLLALAGV